MAQSDWVLTLTDLMIWQHQASSDSVQTALTVGASIMMAGEQRSNSGLMVPHQSKGWRDSESTIRITL